MLAATTTCKAAARQCKKRRERGRERERGRKDERERERKGDAGETEDRGVEEGANQSGARHAPFLPSLSRAQSFAPPLKGRRLKGVVVVVVYTWGGRGRGSLSARVRTGEMEGGAGGGEAGGLEKAGEGGGREKREALRACRVPAGRLLAEGGPRYWVSSEPCYSFTISENGRLFIRAEETDATSICLLKCEVMALLDLVAFNDVTGALLLAHNNHLAFRLSASLYTKPTSELLAYGKLGLLFRFFRAPSRPIAEGLVVPTNDALSLYFSFPLSSSYSLANDESVFNLEEGGLAALRLHLTPERLRLLG